MTELQLRRKKNWEDQKVTTKRAQFSRRLLFIKKLGRQQISSIESQSVLSIILLYSNLKIKSLQNNGQTVKI